MAEKLKALKELAPKVAREHADQRQAFDQQRTASAELLDEIIKLVAPALPSIADKITLNTCRSSSTFAATGYNDDARWRGIKILQTAPDLVGVFSEVFLLVDGTFLLLKRNSAPGLGQEDEFEFLDAGSMADAVEDLVSILADLLSRQKRAPSATRARARAEKLNALAALLR